MKQRRLNRTALFVASKQFGSACVGGRSSVLGRGHGGNCRIPSAGQLRQQINALGHSTFHEYDLLGREVYTWGPATYPVVQGYDVYGQRNLLRTFRDTNADFSTSLFPTTATGDTTTWVFDEATGLLLQKLYADNKGPTYTYYADGLLKTRTWARTGTNNNPLTTAYAYTPQGWLGAVDYSDDTPDVAYTYNSIGQQTSVSDGGGIRMFTYDPVSQSLTQEVFNGVVEGTLNRAYDVLNRPTGYALAEDGVNNLWNTSTPSVVTAGAYTYDDHGNLVQVQADTVPSTLATGFSTASLVPGSFTYARVLNSGLISTIAGPANIVENTYENNRDVLVGKKNKITAGVNANTIISQYDYLANAIAQRINRIRSGSAFSTASTDNFNYNPRGEIIGSTNGLDSTQNRNYAYDLIGNRTNSAEGAATTPSSSSVYVSNALNQYAQITTTSQNTTTATFAYDDDGNMFTDDTGKTYVWDCENRLVQVNLPNGEIVRYTHDSNNRRVKREYIASANSEVTTYLYDGWNVIAEKRTIASIANPVMQTHVWGLDLSNTAQKAGGVGGLLRTIVHSGGATEHLFYTYDGNGNITELLDSSGETRASYIYDVYGNEISASGPLSAQNKYRFSTKVWDEKTGLYYYGHRFYFPREGRWINRDPIGELGGKNLYFFAKNNASQNYDYLGLKASPPKNGEERPCCPMTPSEGKSSPEGNKKVTDDAGRTCCASTLADYEVRVNCPGKTVREQVLENIRNGRPAEEGIQTGHTFICFDGGCIGFGPNEEQYWGSAAGVFSDDSSEGFNFSKKFKVCPATDKLIKKKIEDSKKSPPIYNLLDDNLTNQSAQCTTWVLEVLSSAGVPLPFIQEPCDLAGQNGFESVPKPSPNVILGVPNRL